MAALRAAVGGRERRCATIGLRSLDLTGVTYDPLRDRFRLSPDPAVNYMLFAVRDAPVRPSCGGSQGIWPTLMPSSTSSLASARVASP